LGLKATEIYSVLVLETRSPKSRSWQDHALLKVLEESLFHACAWASSVPALFGLQLHLSSLCLRGYMASPRVSLHMSLLPGSPVTLDQPFPERPHLIYISKDPDPIGSCFQIWYILQCEGLGGQQHPFREHNATHSACHWGKLHSICRKP
jgi:hypothetical protein